MECANGISYIRHENLNSSINEDIITVHNNFRIDFCLLLLDIDFECEENRSHQILFKRTHNKASMKIIRYFLKLLHFRTIYGLVYSTININKYCNVDSMVLRLY